MKNFEHHFRNSGHFTARKRYVIQSIRNNYKIYSRQDLSVSECLPVSASLVTDLVVYHNIKINLPGASYDTMLVVSVNYYAMLYMDLYSGFYAVNKKHAWLQIFALIEEVLRESHNTGLLISEDIDEAVNSSRDISKQVVDVFYRAGVDGCKKLLSASIYAILLTGNRHTSVDREQIDRIVGDLYVKKLLNGNFSAVYSNS